MQNYGIRTEFHKTYRILCHSERAKRVEESSAYQQCTTKKSPVVVPCIFLGDSAPSSSAVRLGCPISSLLINQLRQLSTPAHTFDLLYLPPAAQTKSGHCHSLRSLHPPLAALPSLPFDSLRSLRMTRLLGAVNDCLAH